MVVTGSREWSERARLWRILDGLWTMTEGRVDLAVGDCPTGADKDVRDYCAHNGVEHCLTVYHADWSTGLGGGPQRNRTMVNTHQPDLTLAFYARPPAENKGTDGCYRYAEEWGSSVFAYEEGNDLGHRRV